MSLLFQNTILECDYRVKGYDPKNALPHNDNSIEFIQFWSDGGFFMVGNKIIPIKPGLILLIDAVNMHYSNPSVLEKYTRNKIIIPANCFDRICSLCGFEELDKLLKENGFFVYYTNSSNNIVQSADKLFHETFRCFSNSKNIPFAKARIVECIIQILLSITASMEVKIIDDNTHDTVHQLTNYINMQINTWEDINLDNICNALHISRSYAAHLFKELTNKSITQYTMDLRLSEAKKMLLTTDLKIFDIAEMLNFKDSTTFCKTFKKYIGCTPRTYRMSNGKSES